MCKKHKRALAMTKPIEVLERTLRGWVLAEAQLGHPAVDLADARDALSQVEAVVAALEWALPLAIDADTGILSDDLYTQWIVKKQQARKALGPFQVQP